MAAVPPIRGLLDLSTAHLPPQLAQTLAAQPGVIAYRTACGWLMHVPEAGDDSHQIPPEVRLINSAARELRCAYVLFDGSAPRWDRLPAWDWD